ncbi:MAG TPA: DUF6789 family protein [Candidatus Acidoferrales bacterium]|nr:DUF6789 family protein [Candidatus Acidoferrales bacterium]
MKSLIRGAFAGTVATAVMSGLMLGAQRLGVTGTLPPEKITARLLRRRGIHPSRGQQDAVATGLHFAFGAAAGGAFGVIARRVPVPSVPLGMAYGAGIWGVSYMGWLPSMGLMPRADHDRRDRQAVMLAGHLVFGATLGMLAGRRRRSHDAAETEDGAAEEA